MKKSVVSKRYRSAHSSMIEGLESRQLLSATVAHLAPLAAKVKAPPPLVQLSAVGPKKILAGSKPGTETVTVHNYTTAAVTEEVIITIAPSLDGVTAAGSFGIAPVDETVTIKKKGTLKIKVPFVPPITLEAGKYFTLATVSVGGTVVNATAPGTYTLTLPPMPTTTPSLIGHYQGLITAIKSQSTGFFGGGTSTTIHQLSIIWETTGQDLTSLTGLFAVGDQNSDNNTMEGYELTNGVIHYTLASTDINYTLDGKVSANGATITGKIKAVLVNNLFKTIGGTFKMTLQTP
jgi:hypothetical protein